MPFALPEGLLPVGRGSAVRLHRPVGRPIMLLNLYLPAASEVLAAKLLDDVFSFAAARGDETILLGDFNLPPDRAPIADARAAGFWRLADETVEGDIPLRPTRRDEHGQPTGRCVDFALSTVGVPALDRQQTPGPADHDLVSYSFSLEKDTRELPRAPSRRPLPADLPPVTTEAWEQAWAQHDAAFDQALHATDVNAAWVLLSHAAESLLTGDPHTDAGHLPRAWVISPRPRPSPSTKSEALQSHPERRLRRLARRALELQRRPEDPSASGLRQRVLRDAVELGLMDCASPQVIADAALRRAAQLEVSASQCRVRQWHDAVQNNVHRLRRWVCRTAAPAPGPLDDAPVHPIDIVAAEHAKWGAQWSIPAPHTSEETRDWCARLGPATAPWADDLLHPTPAAVLACLRASSRRAAGLDSWAPAALALLPLPFFQLLTRLWTCCLSACKLPHSWHHVRITLLPKEDGGLRPLAIASALWRALGTVVVRNLRAWALSWAPPSLLGSMPGRSCADLHASFAADLHHARTNRLHFAGYKADIKRCFDSVHVAQALEVARWLGAPRALLPLLQHFYAMQQRHMSWQGVYHPSAIRPVAGLLQGCPFSPLLLNCIVCVWVRVVQQAVPRAVIATYLDDRTVWSVGRQPGPLVLAAAQAGDPVDRFFGLRHHPEKLACFGTGTLTKSFLVTNAQWLGPLRPHFVLLGVHYAVGLTCLPETTKLSAVVASRCQRIGFAARGMALRRALVRQLVLPLFAWCAPWSQFKVTHVQAWTRNVAFALWGRPPAPSRSRLLLWHVTGRPHLHPEHAMDFVVARQEWYRCSRQPAVVLTRPAIVPRWPAVLKKWGWTCQADGSWRTPLGVLKPGWDGLCALRRAADYAFLQRLWKEDAKSAPFDLALSTP
ncbi:pol, partial [Symbiodinium sp. CCMP2456]